MRGLGGGGGKREGGRRSVACGFVFALFCSARALAADARCSFSISFSSRASSTQPHHKRTKVGPLLPRAVHELAPLLRFGVGRVDQRQHQRPARDNARAAGEDVVAQEGLEDGGLARGLLGRWVGWERERESERFVGRGARGGDAESARVSIIGGVGAVVAPLSQLPVLSSLFSRVCRARLARDELSSSEEERTVNRLLPPARACA